LIGQIEAQQSTIASPVEEQSAASGEISASVNDIAVTEYVFPAGLATVSIGREADLGSYREPNVWIVHPTPPG
jgi:hypothetical protein